MIESEQVLLGKRSNELDSEKWIANRLGMDQVRQRRDPLGLAMEGFHQQSCQIFAGQRRQDDLVDVRPRVADHIQLAPQRVGRVDFIVPVSADQQ